MTALWVLMMMSVLPMSHADSKSGMLLSPCQYFVSSDGTSEDRLISFLQHLEKSGPALSRERLISLLQQLTGESDSVALKNHSKPSSSLVEHILDGLVANVQNRSVVAQWLAAYLEGKDAIRVERARVEEETASSVRKMHFVEVKGGIFDIPKSLHGHGTKDLVIRLPYDFEVMDVPVTQAMWGQVTGDLPEWRTADIDPAELMAMAVGGEALEMVPNHPVQLVTIQSMMAFANLLSEQRGLKSVYVFEGASGSLGKGTWIAEDVGVDGSNFSDLEGYRFPSELEWAILAVQAHKELNYLSEDQRRIRIGDWVGKESPMNQLRAVALHRPTEVRGKFIYDLFGLVREMVHNFVEPVDIYKVADMIPIHEMRRNSTVVMRSMSFSDVKSSRYSDFRSDEFRITKSYFGGSASLLTGVGFRLVRTIRKRDPGQM